MTKTKRKRLPHLSEEQKVDTCHKLMVHHFERSMEELMLSANYKERFSPEKIFKGKNRQDDFLMARKYACWLHATFFLGLWKKYDVAINPGLFEFYSGGHYKPFDKAQILEDFKKFCYFLKQNFNFYQGKEIEGPEQANFSCFNREDYPGVVKPRNNSKRVAKNEDARARELLSTLE